MSCYGCGGRGHKRIDCPLNKKNAAKCYECNSVFHKLRDCPKKRDREYNEQLKIKMDTLLMQTKEEYKNTYQKVKIRNKEEIIEAFKRWGTNPKYHNLVSFYVGERENEAGVRDRIFMRSNPDIIFQWYMYQLKEHDTIEKFVDFLEVWGCVNVLSSIYYEKCWTDVIDALTAKGLLSYGNPVADKRDSTTALTYYLINRKQVNHCPHVRGNEIINRITGEGVYFDEICALYNKTFGGNIQSYLKGIPEIIKIEYI